MSFHEVRFPTDILYGSSGGPEFSTDIIVTGGGHEQRNINWENARARYNVAHGVKTQAQLDELIAFFRARRGRGYGFRFRDWADYKVTGGEIATGDGEEKVFQLVKKYVSGGETIVRPVTKIVSGTLKIYFGTTQQLSGWSVNLNTGIVTFNTAPDDGVFIKADFEFDVPVRFDTDRLSSRLDDYGISSWADIPLIEIR